MLEHQPPNGIAANYTEYGILKKEMPSFVRGNVILSANIGQSHTYAFSSLLFPVSSS